MKIPILLLTFESLLLVNAVSSKSGDDPNPPVSHTYSCAAQEQTCGKNTDRYYELVAGYNKYWVPNFPS